LGKSDIEINITREDFEEAIAYLIFKIEGLIKETLKKAEMKPNQIDMVLLAGGSSLIPAVQNVVKKIFSPGKVRVHDNPLTSISQGLAIAGGLLQGQKVHNDITDFDYGLWDDREKAVSVIIKAGTKYSDTMFDINNDIGIKKVYQVINDQSDHILLEVYAKESNIDIKLHEIKIPITPGPINTNRFKIFFTIDDKKGWFSVKVYDLFEADWIEPPTESNVRLHW